MNFETFAFVPWEQKRNQIAFLTRKNKSDLAQVLNILRLRGCLQGWQLVPIEGLDEEGVAQVLGQSRLFLSFGHQEGLCLSNLEALACGCRLIGYDGIAGREYFSPTNLEAIAVGDIISFCRAVETFLASAVDLAACHAQQAAQAARFIRKTYSAERERSSLVAAMRALLGEGSGNDRSGPQASP